jgi:hypothetical protein
MDEGLTRGVVLLAHAYLHWDRDHAGLRSSIFRRDSRLRGYGCGELVFDPQGTGGLSTGLPGRPQPRILRRRQPQVDPTPAGLNGVLEHLPALRVAPCSPTPGQLPNVATWKSRSLSRLQL